jgi:hypothetical protein
MGMERFPAVELSFYTTLMEVSYAYTMRCQHYSPIHGLIF